VSNNTEPATHRPQRPRRVEDAERLDLAIHASIARTPTPTLDVAMSRLSRAADYSCLSLASAGPLGLYPADVLACAVMGTALAQLTTYAGDRRRPARTA
jgi:undecaprenyl-diphosphatase